MTMKKSRNRKAISKLLLALSAAPLSMAASMTSVSAVDSALKGQSVEEATRAADAGLTDVTLLEASYSYRDTGNSKAAADDWVAKTDALVAQFNSSAAAKKGARFLKSTIKAGDDDPIADCGSLKNAFVADGKIKRTVAPKRYIDQLSANPEVFNAVKTALGVDQIIVDTTADDKLLDGKLYCLKMTIVGGKTALVTCTQSDCGVAMAAAALELENPENGGLTRDKLKRVDINTSTPENLVGLEDNANMPSFYYVGSIGKNTIELGCKPTTGPWVTVPPKQKYNAIWSAVGSNSADKNGPAICADVTGMPSLADATNGKTPAEVVAVKLERLMKMFESLANAYGAAADKDGVAPETKKFCSRMKAEFLIGYMYTVALKSQQAKLQSQNPPQTIAGDTQIAGSALTALLASISGYAPSRLTMDTLIAHALASLTRGVDAGGRLASYSTAIWDANNCVKQAEALYAIGTDYLNKLAGQSASEFIASYDSMKKALDQSGVDAENAANEANGTLEQLRTTMKAQIDQLKIKKANDEAQLKQTYETTQKAAWQEEAKKQATDALAPNMAVLGSKSKDTIGLVGLPAIGLAGGFLLAKTLSSKTQPSNIQQKALATTAQGGKSASAPKSKTVSKP